MPNFDDEDDDFKPRKNTRVERDDEDDDDEDAPRRNRSNSRDDDDDAPKQPKRTIKRGWGAAETVKANASAFAQKLKLDSNEAVLVKFLEDEPYASFYQHWLEGRPGQKSFTCIADSDERGCPLCDSGSRPAARFSFNVLLMAEDGEDPQIKSYDVGSRVLDTLKDLNNDPKQGPLSRHYWAIKRSGKGGTSSTNHQMVKERDLEDWHMEPLDEADLRAFRKKMYDESIIPIPSRKDLLALTDDD